MHFLWDKVSWQFKLLKYLHLLKYFCAPTATCSHAWLPSWTRHELGASACVHESTRCCVPRPSELRQPVLQQHCSSIALAVYQHCSSIALAVYQQCSGSAAALHQHCTGSVPAVPGTLFLQHLCGLSPMAVVLVATNDPAQSQTLLTRQCYIA